MAGNFHESYSAEAAPMPSDRSTGLVLAAALLVLGLLWRKTGVVLYPAVFMAAALAAMALACPHVLAPVTSLWFRFGLLLHRIVSPVVMFLIFAIAVVPFGLAMQLRRDPLKRRSAADGSLDTYWLKADAEGPGRSDMKRQF